MFFKKKQFEDGKENVQRVTKMSGKCLILSWKLLFQQSFTVSMSLSTRLQFMPLDSYPPG